MLDLITILPAPGVFRVFTKRPIVAEISAEHGEEYRLDIIRIFKYVHYSDIL